MFLLCVCGGGGGGGGWGGGGGGGGGAWTKRWAVRVLACMYIACNAGFVVLVRTCMHV